MKSSKIHYYQEVLGAKYVLFVLVTFLSLNIAHTQVISQFNFDSDPVTTAAVGPDATSVSGSALSDVGGVGGTNGVNAGLPKADIKRPISI